MKQRTKKIISYIVAIAVIIGAAVWVGSRFILWENKFESP